MSSTSLPFTHEMVVVHKAFRREFGQAATWVRRVPAGDTAQAALVHGHLGRAFAMLHHHHEAEDVVLWPRLRQRATDHAELLDAMEAQHSAIDPALAEAAVLGERWATTGDPADRDAYADALDAMWGPLRAHLDQEEAEILPLAQRLLTEEEWGELGQHAIAHTPRKDLLTGFAGILEDATAEERAMMMGVLPAVPKVLYRLVGRRAYVKQATAVRGAPPVGL
jgi:hemerythrin-like domain-containing protein